MNLIIYTDNEKYRMHCEEYKIIWEKEGKKIQDAYEKVLHIPFKEKEIKLLINSGKDGSNYSGDTINDEMNFRYNNRCKIGTFLHELSHRIIMEYDLFSKGKKLYNYKDIHEVVDLFLYDVICNLYGEESANMRVEYESGFEEETYRTSWEEALSKTYEERQEIIKRIMEVE